MKYIQYTQYVLNLHGPLVRLNFHYTRLVSLVGYVLISFVFFLFLCMTIHLPHSVLGQKPNAISLLSQPAAAHKMTGPKPNSNQIRSSNTKEFIGPKPNKREQFSWALINGPDPFTLLLSSLFLLLCTFNVYCMTNIFLFLFVNLDEPLVALMGLV